MIFMFKTLTAVHLGPNTIAIAEPNPVTASALVTSNYNGQDISCAGASDGQITMTGIGGQLHTCLILIILVCLQMQRLTIYHQEYMILLSRTLMDVQIHL